VREKIAKSSDLVIAEKNKPSREPSKVQGVHRELCYSTMKPRLNRLFVSDRESVEMPGGGEAGGWGQSTTDREQ
jgi:hypothetical protein